MINPFSVLTSKIFAVTTVAALAFGAIQTARIDGFLFIDGYIDKVAARDATIAAMKSAQKVATELAQAEKRRIENQNERKAQYAKRDYEARLADSAGNLNKWMRDNANRARQADMPGASESPGRIVEASAAPELPDRYLVTGRDLELTADAFAKLEALQSWASSIGDTQ
jgi:hypothetical protein